MTPLANPLARSSSTHLVAVPPGAVAPFDPTACPACRTPLESLAFCPRDGAIGREGRFTIATRYVAEELLGAGERSFVYAAYRDGKPVAIKLLRDADTSSSSPAARKFLREARNASQLAHDNTIAIHEFGHDESLGVPFIAMELFSGQSLERVLRTSGPMPVARAIPILVQIARSLADAHMAGVLHRDVTARSVLVGRGDLVKVGDYGLGRADDASGSEADVLGLGRLAVTMLRGRTAAVPQAMLDKVSTTIPADLHRLLAQCLDPNGSARPRAPEIVERLLAVGTQPVVVAPPPPAPPPPAPVFVAPPPPVYVAPPPPAPVYVAPPPPAPVFVAPPPPAPVYVAPPPPAPVFVAPPSPVVVDTPVPVAPMPEPMPDVDALDDAEPSTVAPRWNARWWIAGAAAAVVAIVAIVVIATWSSTSTSTTVRSDHAVAPAPPPVPLASRSPAVEPEHVVAHELPPPPPPAPDPVPPPPPPPMKPAAAAATPAPAPAKRPKHKDDAVIADPFSD